MINCHQHLRQHRPAVKMILTLHDELHFEVPTDQVDGFAVELPGLMCNLGLERFGFDVPFQVEVKIGDTWGRMAKRKGRQDGEQRHN